MATGRERLKRKQQQHTRKYWLLLFHWVLSYLHTFEFWQCKHNGTHQTHAHIHQHNTTKRIRKNYRLFMRLISFKLEHSAFFLFVLFSVSARVIAYYTVVVNFLAIPNRYKGGQCAGACAQTQSHAFTQRGRKKERERERHLYSGVSLCITQNLSGIWIVDEFAIVNEGAAVCKQELQKNQYIIGKEHKK